MKNISNPLNLIYFCTAEKGPSGGAKIVYNHSDQINKLNITNLTSEIIHIKKKKISKIKGISANRVKKEIEALKAKKLCL